MMRTVLFAFLVLAALVFAMVAGGVHVVTNFVRENTLTLGETETLRREIAPDNVDRLDVAIEIGVGDLSVTATDGPSAFAAVLTDNVVELSPIVAYDEQDGRGAITVRPDGPMGLPSAEGFEDALFDWAIELGQSPPISLTVEMGVGRAVIDLAGAPITRFTMDLGVGDALIDLRGARTLPLTAEINGGTGRIVVLLPVDTAIYAETAVAIGGVETTGLQAASDGDGEWINDVYGQEEAMIRLEVDMGMGDIELIATDDPNVGVELLE
jgi:hypothetical protein